MIWKYGEWLASPSSIVLYTKRTSEDGHPIHHHTHPPISAPDSLYTIIMLLSITSICQRCEVLSSVDIIFNRILACPLVMECYTLL